MTMTAPKVVLLLAMLILGNFTSSTMSQAPASPDSNLNRLFKYYHVYITNDMPPDGKEVKVHCWSSENDIGERVLAPNEAYFFQFQLNFWKSTRFECEAFWGYVHTAFTGFNAYRDEGSRCDFHCWWSIRKEGIFFSHDKSNWKIEYWW